MYEALKGPDLMFFGKNTLYYMWSYNFPKTTYRQVVTFFLNFAILYWFCHT